MLKSSFSDIRFSEPKIRFFSIIVFLVRLCVVNALTFHWWSRLLLSLAILSSCVCSSSGAFLHSHCLIITVCTFWRSALHTSFGAPNSRPGYRGSTTIATTYRLTARQSRHQKACRRQLASLAESDYC